MNRHHGSNFKPTGKLVGLTLIAAMSAALGCSSSPGTSTPGTGGSGTGKGGSTGTAGATGTGGTAAGTGGTAAGTGGTAAGTGGTGGSISTGGTGGTAGTGTGGGGTAGGGTSGGGTSGGGTAGGGTSGGGTGGGGTGGSGGSSPPANLPPTLNAPSGAAVKFYLHAMGDQIYTCTASTAGAAGTGGAGGAGGSGATTYSFVLKQPDAKLYTPGTTTQVGTHGLGPNWTSTVDGSVVNGAKVYQENSPTAGAIPWLLLRATSNTGTGVFSDVTYVQRVNTTGGAAPATGCDSNAAGMDTRVSYTADYYFYTGGGPGTAWMAPPANLQPTLAVPNGATLKIHDHAIGAQVYTCTASAAGGAGGSGAGGAGGSATTYSWVLKQPDAVLYDSSFAMVGTHGLGPNWTSTDGSIVNGAKVFGENVPGAIQWLLLHATSNTGTTGVFSDVTYVIRANTAGGVAPATGCDSATAGMDTRVNYSADYYFYSGGGPGTAWLTPPANLPAAIAVPSGATLKLHDHAIGAQVYTCTASAAGGAGGSGAGGAGGATTYSWVLKQPDAVLYDQSLAMVGTHGLGPNWTSTDGSVVNGAKVAGVNSTATGAIQWLLLMATTNTGTGVFGDVTYVQRLNTAGGVAPATGCDSTTAATDTRVSYSADYYFFNGGATDGGTGG